ncbi:MAG TPA: NAD(P)H-dependent oxidoreductase [Burkholderiales bacterium]|nr:NAD(P)H-dependent oxidoreductase [Burkholderiales bacterium]
MLSTIALFASSRRNGNTGQLMDCIAQELDIEVVDLATRSMSCYDYEHRNRIDDFEPLMQRILAFEQIIFASPVYWYAVSPPMKIFLDRVSDFLDLPDLLEQGRGLRRKTGFVVCTSIYDEVPAPFIGAFRDTFDYLGMRFGGCAHANCRDGFEPVRHVSEALAFARRVRSGGES